MSAELKIVIMGGGGVGKSAITIRFIQHSFLEEYDPTIEDSYRKQTMIDNEVYLLDILDTAGQEEYSAMRDQYLRNADGYILVYAVTMRNTFEELITIYDQIYRVGDVDKNVKTIPIVIAANKIDMLNDRQITTEEGKELAKNMKAKYIETSAKTGHNIEETFQEIIREIVKLKTGSEPEKKKKKKKECSLL